MYLLHAKGNLEFEWFLVKHNIPHHYFEYKYLEDICKVKIFRLIKIREAPQGAFFVLQSCLWCDGEVANTAVCKTAIRGCKSRSHLQTMLESPRFAALFEGQGQQYPGMYSDLYRDSIHARDIFNRADVLARNAGLHFSIAESCFETDSTRNILTGENYNPVALQLSLLTGQIATSSYLHANGVPFAEMNGGHSLGQMAASVESGFMKFDTAFNITVERARLMEVVGQKKEAMVCVFSDARKQLGEEADNLRGIVSGALSNFGEKVERTKITVQNHSRQLVATGPIEELDHLREYLGEAYKGIKMRYMPNIPVSHHPIFMKDAQLEFSKFVETLKHEFEENALVPQLADIKDEVMRRISSFTGLLDTHLISEVFWTATQARLALLGIPLAVQIGPGNIFVNMMKVDHPDVEVLTTHDLPAMQNVVKRLAI